MGEENTQNAAQSDIDMIQFDPSIQDQKNSGVTQDDLDTAHDVSIAEESGMTVMSSEDVHDIQQEEGEDMTSSEEMTEVTQNVEEGGVLEDENVAVQADGELTHEKASENVEAADESVSPVVAVSAVAATAIAPDEEKSQQQTQEATTPLQESTDTEKKTIMVVEDDMFISDIYDVKLTAAGYNVISANNGRDAIEKLNSGIYPHLMLLDIVMPYMDGFDVLEALSQKEKLRHIPIVLLTNLSQKEDIDRAMNLGASDYLIKSHFTPSEVLSKVEKYIRKD